MNHIRYIAVTLLLLSPFGLFAQQSIDSAMKALEDAKSVTNEVYSERRNPTTKEIESASYLFEFTDNKLADKIIDAMRKERSKACAYEMSNRHSNSLVYSISFQSANGSFSKYTLLQRGSSKWMLSVKKGTAAKSTKSSSKSSSKSKSTSKKRTDIFGIDDKLIELYGLDPSVSDYAHTDGNTTIYTGPDGNTIIINNGRLSDIQALSDSGYVLNLDGLEQLESLESLRSLESLKDLQNLKDLEKLKKQKKSPKSESGSRKSKTSTTTYTSSDGRTTTTSITYDL